jgi:DNA replication protein DnaC
LARAEVLFFDDLGKVPLTERVEAEFFALIERRMARQLPITVTSNMTGDDLAAKASTDRGRPLIRRLREFCRVVVF